MTKETVFSLVRMILTGVGAFLIGKSFLGAAIDHDLWQGLGGVVLSLISIGWGIFDKSATIEMIQSGLRSSIIVVGGILISTGNMNEEVLNVILGLVGVLVPFLYSSLSRQKSAALSAGNLDVETLK